MQSLTFSNVFSVWKILTENLEKTTEWKGFRSQLDDFCFAYACFEEKVLCLSFALSAR